MHGAGLRPWAEHDADTGDGVGAPSSGPRAGGTPSPPRAAREGAAMTRSRGRRAIGRQGARGSRWKIHSILSCASSGPQWKESRFTLCGRLLGKRPKQSKNNQSVWTTFSLIFTENPLISGTNRDLMCCWVAGTGTRLPDVEWKQQGGGLVTRTLYPT